MYIFSLVVFAIVGHMWYRESCKRFDAETLLQMHGIEIPRKKKQAKRVLERAKFERTQR